MLPSKELYNWKQKETVQRMKNRDEDSLKHWMEKVRKASDTAAKEALGGDFLQKDILNVIPDDEALYEAQQLVDGWIQEKTFEDISDEMFFSQEKSDSSFHRFGKNSEREEDTKFEWHVYKDEEESEQVLVDEVLKDMMNKEFPKDIDLGMKPLFKQINDPLPKMNLRHQHVKNKSKARKQRDEKRKQELQCREEVRKKARDRIRDEEEERKQRQRTEEEEIQREMLKLRQELHEKKKKQEEEIERKAKILEEAKKQMQRELQKKKEAERQQRSQREAIEEEGKRRKEKRIQFQSIMEMKSNMQILHKHFAAWYNLILKRRIAMGKARAISEWKCKIRAWNAWRAYVVAVKSSHEAMLIEQSIKENYRKEQMAVNHANRNLLNVCFCVWRRYSRHKIDKKLLKLEHEKKAKKMAMFLEAISKNMNEDRRSGGSSDSSNENCIEIDCQTPWESELKLKNKLKECHTHPHQNHSKKRNNQKTVGRSVEEDLLRHHKQTDPPAHFAVKEIKNIDTNVKVKNSAKYNDPHRTEKRKHVHAMKTEEQRKSSANCKDFEGSFISQENKPDKPVTVYDYVVEEKHFTSFYKQSRDASRKATPRIRSEKPVTKPLHLAMEERALQRKERKEKSEAEKRNKEELRLKELREQQAEIERQEETKKQERIRKRKEEKKIEAEKERQRIERIADIREKSTMSQQHYEKHLLRKYGIQPLKRFLRVQRSNAQIADNFHHKSCLMKVFQRWNEKKRSIISEKEQRADRKYNEILVNRYFASWKKCRFHLQMLNKLARIHCIDQRKKRVFHAWQDFVTDERILMWAKESDAEDHDLMRMKKKYLMSWKRFVADEKEERAREVRREVLRKKVQAWLPDFNVNATTNDN